MRYEHDCRLQEEVNRVDAQLPTNATAISFYHRCLVCKQKWMIRFVRGGSWNAEKIGRRRTLKLEVKP